MFPFHPTQYTVTTRFHDITRVPGRGVDLYLLQFPTETVKVSHVVDRPRPVTGSRGVEIDRLHHVILGGGVMNTVIPVHGHATRHRDEIILQTSLHRVRPRFRNAKGENPARASAGSHHRATF